MKHRQVLAVSKIGGVKTGNTRSLGSIIPAMILVLMEPTPISQIEPV